jgi:hypothetical protein
MAVSPHPTAAKIKASEALLKQLEKSLAEDGESLVAAVKVGAIPGFPAALRARRRGDSDPHALQPKLLGAAAWRRARLGPPDCALPSAAAPPCPLPPPQGLVVLKIDDEQWTLDLRRGSKGSLARGAPADKPDLTLTVSDANFAALVMGKMNPQQVWQPGADAGGAPAACPGGCRSCW